MTGSQPWCGKKSEKEPTDGSPYHSISSPKRLCYKVYFYTQTPTFGLPTVMCLYRFMKFRKVWLWGFGKKRPMYTLHPQLLRFRVFSFISDQRIHYRSDFNQTQKGKIKHLLFSTQLQANTLNKNVQSMHYICMLVTFASRNPSTSLVVVCSRVGMVKEHFDFLSYFGTGKICAVISS